HCRLFDEALQPGIQQRIIDIAAGRSRKRGESQIGRGDLLLARLPMPARSAGACNRQCADQERERGDPNLELSFQILAFLRPRRAWLLGGGGSIVKGDGCAEPKSTHAETLAA